MHICIDRCLEMGYTSKYRHLQPLMFLGNMMIHTSIATSSLRVPSKGGVLTQNHLGDLGPTANTSNTYYLVI